jgi:hypothetical protein
LTNFLVKGDKNSHLREIALVAAIRCVAMTERREVAMAWFGWSRKARGTILPKNPAARQRQMP